MKVTKKWYKANQKIIVASFVALLIAVFFMSPKFIFTISSSIFCDLAYSTEKLYKVSSNPSAAAFFGSFFAFLGMFILNYVERERKENINSKNALTFISRIMDEYEILIIGNQKGINDQIEAVTKGKVLGCRREPLILLTPIDFNIIIRIKDERIKNDLFKSNALLIGVNSDLNFFNEFFSSKKIFQEDSIIIDNIINTDKKKLLKNFEYGKAQIENFKDFISVIRKNLNKM